MAQEESKTIEQLSQEADIAADYLEGLLDIADYDGDIELGVRNNRPTVQIVADDSDDIKHLIGHNGEVVDALQQLARLAVQQKTGDRSHLILDVDGYLKRKAPASARSRA
jgi:spoIIIJ-associated protein